MKMNLSQKRVLESVRNTDAFYNNDLGFIFTVLRDNCVGDDDTREFLDMLVQILWERRRKEW